MKNRDKDSLTDIHVSDVPRSSAMLTVTVLTPECAETRGAEDAEDVKMTCRLLTLPNYGVCKYAMDKINKYISLIIV